jgi:hypothetical protein
MFRIVFWVFIFFLALSFFGISLEKIITSPAGQANINYILNLLTQLWLWATFWIRPAA